ncbi:hypothetical protein PT286_08705 [Neisseriaceae bacterium ESL0693]|nr:hypothetical protein [Neisseriaceae bacterium ESL0693]
MMAIIYTAFSRPIRLHIMRLFSVLLQNISLNHRAVVFVAFGGTA